MQRLRRSRGFTIVELLVVIVILAILSTLAFVAYDKAQMQARDTKMRDAADKFADAISLWSQQHNGIRPYGGYDTSLTNYYDTATENCALSTKISGWAAAKFRAAGSNYACTVGDVMVNGGYLPANFFTNLDSPVVPYLREFMIPSCPADNATAIYLIYVLEQPTAAETANFGTLSASCAEVASWATSYKVNAYKKILL